MALLAISFIAGVLSTLAPCILPLLPVVVGGSLDATVNWRKAATVTLSLAVSIIAFTLLLKASTLFIFVDEAIWMRISGGILVLLGLFFLFPELWERVPGLGRVQGLFVQGVSSGTGARSIVGDIIAGAALGPVFSSCSPTYFIILATILPIAPAAGVLYILSYAAGLSIALFLIALASQAVLSRLNAAADPRGVLKRGVGLVLLVVGLLIFTGLDKRAETALLSAGMFDITGIETELLNARGMDGAVPNGPVNGVLSPEEKARVLKRAPELVAPDGYLNTGGEPITIGQFRDHKVVLVDFWTYSCINCLRTLPHLASWYDSYEDEGLVIIGVHTPEFAFEHKKENVERALENLGIRYPVVQDNEYQTWNAYGNNYWPRKYLVDIDGYIVYDHVGEGGYEETEEAIRRALEERASRLGISGQLSESAAPEPADLSGIASPETYFGAARNQNFGNGIPGETGSRTFNLPQNTVRNYLYLNGPWRITDEYAESEGASSIVYRFDARDVYLVASAPEGVEIEILLDGHEVGADAGADIGSGGAGTIDEERLYKLVHLEEPGVHTLEIRVSGPGLQAYTFTFG